MAGVDKEATLVSLECHTSPPAACTDFPPQVIISVVLTDPFCLTCLTCLSCLACLVYPDALSSLPRILPRRRTRGRRPPDND